MTNPDDGNDSYLWLVVAFIVMGLAAAGFIIAQIFTATQGGIK